MMLDAAYIAGRIAALKLERETHQRQAEKIDFGYAVIIRELEQMLAQSPAPTAPDGWARTDEGAASGG